ncbi:hypothetical protein GEMRC1_010397 [Eukaryota sp. GEM-RC1]
MIAEYLTVKRNSCNHSQSLKDDVIKFWNISSKTQLKTFLKDLGGKTPRLRRSTTIENNVTTSRCGSLDNINIAVVTLFAEGLFPSLANFFCTISASPDCIVTPAIELKQRHQRTLPD